MAAFDLVAPEHPGILGVACDVSDEDAVDRAFGTVESTLGTVSVLVINAGIFPIVPFEETTRELWDRTLAINLTGALPVRPTGAAAHARAAATAGSWPSDRVPARPAGPGAWRHTPLPRAG